MNWYTACTYTPDWRLEESPLEVSKASAPDSSRRKYSPCSLRLVADALPLGAHLRTKSAIHVRLLPLNDWVVSRSVKPRSCGEAPRYERPLRHAILSPRSPPTCPNRLQALAP